MVTGNGKWVNGSTVKSYNFSEYLFKKSLQERQSQNWMMPVASCNKITLQKKKKKKKSQILVC